MVTVQEVGAGTPCSTPPAHTPAGGSHTTSLETAHRMPHCSGSLWSGQVGFPPAPPRWPQEPRRARETLGDTSLALCASSGRRDGRRRLSQNFLAPHPRDVVIWPALLCRFGRQYL